MFDIREYFDKFVLLSCVDKESYGDLVFVYHLKCKIKANCCDMHYDLNFMTFKQLNE